MTAVTVTALHTPQNLCYSYANCLTLYLNSSQTHTATLRRQSTLIIARLRVDLLDVDAVFFQSVSEMTCAKHVKLC